MWLVMKCVLDVCGKLELFELARDTSPLDPQECHCSETSRFEIRENHNKVRALHSQSLHPSNSYYINIGDVRYLSLL
jgi:hypothetical protein